MPDDAAPASPWPHPHRWAVFGVCCLFFMISQLYRASVAIISPTLSRDLGLTPESLGLLGAVFFYVFALVQFPLGVILDRVGPKRTMIALNLTGAAGGLVFAAAGGLTGALAGRLLLGLGMSANLIGPLVLFTRWFRKGEFATFSGLLLAMASLGNMLAATPLGLAARAVGWRTTFVGLAGINLVLVAVFWIFVQAAPPGWVPETNDRGGRTWPGARASLRHMLSSWTYWAIALSAGLRYGVFAAIQAVWIGPFLLLDLSLPEVTAGNLMLMLSVGVLVGAPLSGIVSDRLVPSRKATVVTGLALMAASVLTLALWPADAPLVALGAVLFGCGLFSGSAQVMYVHIKEVMPSYMSGVAMTGVNFFVMAGAGGFSHGVGGLLGRGGELGAQLDYQGAFLFLAASAALASVLYLTGRDSRRV